MKYNKNEVTGKMRDRIILQNVTRSRSLTGFASESWSDTTTIWAFAESKLPGSNENIIDGKNTAKNVCDFTIRYISTISEESRVIWGDKLYQVKNIKVSHDRRFISFQGIFYDSYILTGVNVAAAVSGIATSTANIKLLMSVMGQANAIASAIGEIVTAQQGVVEVASNVTALGTSEASITKVISLDGNLAGSAFVDATPMIVQYIETSVNAEGTSIADALVSKTLNASVQGNATATSALDVISQGIASVDASVTATGSVTADILRIATLESSSNTTADTTANATLTKVLEASASATAQTSSDAQLTLAVNASATATAETSANAQLSYTVNAEATATAQTNADAFITRIISAEATATANSSAEAGVGVTFIAAAVGVATSTSAELFRTATMSASATGQANVTAATLTTVDNVAASVSAAATVTNATLTIFDVDTVAFINRVTTAGGSLSSTEQSAINTLVTSLKSAGLWTKMKAIYPMVGASAAACAQNLRSTSFTGTFSSGWTFDSNGVTPNGTSSFMNTGLDGTHLTNNNHSLLFYSRSNVNNAGFQIGSCNNSSFAILTGFRIRNSGNFNGFSQMSSDTPLLIVTNGTSLGMCIWSRVSSTSAKSYMNTSILGTLSNTSTANINSLTNNFYIGSLNIGGSAMQFSTNQCAFASIGDGLTDTEAANFYTIVQSFQTTLSRNV